MGDDYTNKHWYRRRSFNNKLNLSFDFYHKYTTDILQRITYPSTGGVASAPFMNIGEMQNNGYELNINFRIRQTMVSGTN